MKSLIRLFAFLFFSGAGIAAAAAAETPSAEDAAYLEQIELRSVVTLRGETLFSISDPENDRTFWISPGETLHGLEVVGHDADEESITLRYGEVERELSLSRSRVRSTPEPAEVPGEPGEVLSPGERREQWRAMREDMMAFRERWEAAAEDSPEIQAIEERMRETGEAMREVMMGLAEAEEGSEEHRDLLEQRNELGEAFRQNFRETRAIIEDHPGFEARDIEVMDRMRRMAPGGPMGPAQ